MSRKPTPSKSTLSTSNKSQRKPLKTVKLTRHDSDDGPQPPAKKCRTGFALSRPPVFDLTQVDTIASSSSQALVGSSRLAKPGHQSQRSVDVKGKGKETRTSVVDDDDSLWVDKYEPASEAELAVHKRKVEDVRRWLLEAFEGGPSGKLRKYRRILALTGPAGTAKTATVRVLSRELDFDVLEWRNSMNERRPSTFIDGVTTPDEGPDLDTESLFDKFQAFLTRAVTCNSIFGHQNISQEHSQIPSSTSRPRKRQLILLEDLPNLLHQPTQARFQSALRSLCIPSSSLSGIPGPPIVIIISDSGLRAEQPNEDTWDGGSGGRRWDRKEVLDVRNVLGPELLASPHVTHIGFNPIAPTLMTKALQALLAAHFGSLDPHDRAGKQPPREVVDIIVESSNGDIRSAIMALQFACVVDLPASSNKLKGKSVRKNAGTKKPTNARAVLEAVTRREQSLVLFHLMGKILYNKRKFDSPASHLSAKDAAKERELDLQLIDPQPLPTWLSHQERKASRVSIEMLVAESPIDSSLLGLYTHQNYTQFCTDVEQCDGVCEGLSWMDCMSGLASSPYAFPALTLSTLHALPTPVPRRGQKVCKPTWFDVRTRELDASDAVGDVVAWLGKGACGEGDADPGVSVSVGKWTHAHVATELGGWLRAVDKRDGEARLIGSGAPGPRLQPPRHHRSFSYLPWSVEAVRGDVLGDDEVGEVEGESDGEADLRLPGGAVRGGNEGMGWLEEDDIEDVE